MALPLPKVVADVQPGGQLVTSLGGVNALKNAIALKDINQTKAQLAPWTESANALSKLAYANLMGPQFMAKLMQNPGALANMDEPTRQAALQMITRAGMGQGTGNALMNIPVLGRQNTSGFRNPMANWVADKFKGMFGQGNQNPMAQMAQQQQPMSAPQQPSANVPRPPGGVQLEGEQWYDKNGNPVYAQETEEVGGKEPMKLTLTEGQRPPQDEKTWPEKLGEFKGIESEGQELGKIRAKAIDELDNQYQQATQMQKPINELKSLIKDPVFQRLRQIPGFQSLQMDAKANFGNEAEQKLIGRFQAAAQQLVASTIKGFGGRILASEIPLSESMKLAKKDTVGVMLGKLPIIDAFNQMTEQRSNIASQLMQKYHINKGQALQQADKMIDGDAIRAAVEQELNPITEEDIAYTAQQNGMTVDQVKERLRAEGKYNG